ncbi:hypothetical protein C8T65DRAFT_830068 [Cerioporus squamosus]|nr:hypothetical protein C8T65DRAFT_830068 [Cerioporus squamosus]
MRPPFVCSRLLMQLLGHLRAFGALMDCWCVSVIRVSDVLLILQYVLHGLTAISGPAHTDALSSSR